MLDSQVALVTGAGGGIGSVVARRLRQEGWRVLATDREPVPGEALRADLATPEGCAQVSRWAAAQGIGLSALVCCAGILRDAAMSETSDADWDLVHAINVRAPFSLLRDCAPLLGAARGSAVMVSSVHATATSSGLAAYAASKAGLLGLVRAAAVELAKDGVRVNAILPGAIETPMLQAGLMRGDATPAVVADRRRLLEARTPLGRVGLPEEVAAAVSFLVGRDSRFITGASLTVDGGVLCRLGSEE